MRRQSFRLNGESVWFATRRHSSCNRLRRIEREEGDAENGSRPNDLFSLPLRTSYHHSPRDTSTTTKNFLHKNRFHLLTHFFDLNLAQVNYKNRAKKPDNDALMYLKLLVCYILAPTQFFAFWFGSCSFLSFLFSKQFVVN